MYMIRLITDTEVFHYTNFHSTKIDFYLTNPLPRSHPLVKTKGTHLKKYRN